MAPRGKARKGKNKHDGGEDVDGDDNTDRADWDSDLHKIFVKLCVDEKKKGNMPTTHFSSQGWENIVRNFSQETNRAYTRGQLKNHWDCMRKDWYAWNLIKQKSTDLGWDHEKNTPVVPKGWWEELAKVNKLVLKFKKKGLEHDDEYSDLFSRAIRKGNNALAPSQGVSSEGPYIPLPPQDQTSGYNDVSIEENRRDQTEDNNYNDVSIEENRRDQTENNNYNDVSIEENRRDQTDNKNYEEMGSPKNMFPINDFGLRDPPVDDILPPPPNTEQETPSDECQSCGCKRKKMSDADKITDDAFDSSVKRTLKILNQVPGLTKGSSLYLLACRLFANLYNRELFINFEENDLRLTWLKDMELRESQVNPSQQFVHFSGGPAQILAQHASEFSQQIAFSHRVSPSAFTSPQWIAMPVNGFSQLLTQPPPGFAVPNQFPSPSNTLSPHSAPDA